MTAILGISAYYHDSAAALVVDGRIVCAAQEERFTRVKHDHRYPGRAAAWCLEKAGLTAAQVDYVGFYDKPLLKFDRLLETYLAFAPAGFPSFVRAVPLWVREKLHLTREMRRELGGQYKKRFIYAEHHESHAASAFFPSPFDEAAVLTMDGVGEWATASFGVGRGNKIELTHELRFPHSLGLLYSAFTYHAGFRVNSGEYKLMGLAPFGKPVYAPLILERLIDLKGDGSFRMDMSYFNYCQGLTMTGPKFDNAFGGKPRKPESPLTQREMDLAASVQFVTEEVMLRMARHVHAQTGMKNLCLAGGVALNCVGNGRILREGPFDDIWIQPAAGDAGGALGVAMLIWHQLLGKPRDVSGGDAQRGSLLGPSWTNEEVGAFLASVGAKSTRCASENDLCELVAEQIDRGKVIGWFQGGMEFGPRALGARSILGDARSTTMQSSMNLKTKFRESFRPFAPSVLQERVGDYFQVRPNQPSPYMLLVAPVRAERRMEPAANGALKGIDAVRAARSEIPAVTHVDYSARMQTVDATRSPRYHALLKAFERRTGCPVIINTSFNVRGEPIVCTPEQAYRCFMATNMDVLVLQDFVLFKGDQPEAVTHDVDAYLAQFDPD